MGLEVLRRKTDDMTLGLTKVRKEQRMRDFFARWSHGGSVLSLPQFRMALSDLGVPARAAGDVFAELDHCRRGSIEIQEVISRLVPEREVPDHPLQHVRPQMQESRSFSAADLGRAPEAQTPPRVSRAPSVPSSPAGVGGPRSTLDAEALKERKIRGFWDLIGNRAAEKGFRSVAQLLKALDKDANGQLDRLEARRFFKVNLCLAIAKADEFFGLLDDDRDGKVSCREISRCLAPYLEKNYRPDDADAGDEHAARAEQARERELRKFWELIGNRAFDKGFKSVGQLMLQMDKDSDGLLERKELRGFLTTNVGFSQASADHFFDLLDADNRGRVSMAEIRRRLEPYFRKDFREPGEAVSNWRSSAGMATEMEDRQQELKKFWNLIGTKFFQRGYRSAGQVLMAMDKDDSNFLDRTEARDFFLRHLGHGQASADRFFDLLDPSGRGAVSCRAIAQCLAPYFQSTFRDPDEMVGHWEEAPAPEAPQPLPAGRASLGGAGGGASTPGRPGMRRTASMPGWAPQATQGGVRESFGASNGRAVGGPAPAQSAAPPAPVAAESFGAQFEEQPVGPRHDLEVLSRSRPSELGPPRRGTLVAEEAPLPASRGPPAVGSQARERQAPPPAPYLEPPATGPARPAEGLDLSAAVLAEFRRVILERNGTHGIHEFGRTFRIMDTSGNVAVSPAELDVALRRFGLNLKKKDLALLVSVVDEDGSGNISCTEFLRAVRGPVNPRRQRLIDVAFDCLDRNRNGRLEVSDIQNLYDVSQHPEVLNRTMAQDVALEHFLSQFEGVHRDGIVTRKEFSEYYANISAAIDDDDHFELLMRNAWRNGRSWPNMLTGKPLKVRPAADEYVAPRPRRAAMWIGKSR